jgi:hypothetical protein
VNEKTEHSGAWAASERSAMMSSRREKNKSASPLDDGPVASVMALAKQLASIDPQQYSLQSESRRLNYKDGEGNRDYPLKTPVMSRTRKGSWELIIGYFILLALTIVVFSVWIGANTGPNAGPSQPTAAGFGNSEDTIGPHRSANTSASSPTARDALRFAEFGCGSAVCTLSCKTKERIANTFAIDPGATFAYQDERTVSVRPLQLPSSKIVLVCVLQ